MTKVLFVCLGNICRSPMAEAIFNHKILKSGLSDEFIADSCGTANYHVNHRPDHRTIKVLNQKGIETKHLGRQFHLSDFDNFDYILTMDSENHKDIMKLAPNNAAKEKVVLMRTFDTVQTDTNVPDPYYGSFSDFEDVFQILDRSIDHFLVTISLSNKL